jgi:hypothetical protein
LKRQRCLVRLVVVVNFEALSQCCIAGNVGSRFFVVVVIGLTVLVDSVVRCDKNGNVKVSRSQVLESLSNCREKSCGRIRF